jgi:hypothetical protein
MSIKEKAGKLSWELLGFAKEKTKTNIISAVTSGKVKVDSEVLPTLLTLIDASMDEGYNKGYKNFMTNLLKEDNESATNVSKKRK